MGAHTGLKSITLALGLLKTKLLRVGGQGGRREAAGLGESSRSGSPRRAVVGATEVAEQTQVDGLGRRNTYLFMQGLGAAAPLKRSRSPWLGITGIN